MGRKMTKVILVAGATGKQGSALIRALLEPKDLSGVGPGVSYKIHALTRNSSSPAALKLASSYGSEHFTLVEGNLDDRASILAAFESAKDENEGGIWGVYSMTAFPGLGAKTDGEERQGKMLADVALEYNVSIFVYSSAMRAGPRYDDRLDLKPSAKAKANIERHCIELGKSGLKWVFLRPAFFMENFDDFIGSIAFSILKQGLKSYTKLALIASEDIGNVAAEVFKNPERYLHQTLSLTSDFLTTNQIEESYRKATDKPVTSVPAVFAWGLLKINQATQDLIKDIEQNYHARASGEYPELDAEVELAKSAYKMKTYGEFLVKEKNAEGGAGNWNEVSLWKLLAGKL